MKSFLSSRSGQNDLLTCTSKGLLLIVGVACANSLFRCMRPLQFALYFACCPLKIAASYTTHDNQFLWGLPLDLLPCFGIQCKKVLGILSYKNINLGDIGPLEHVSVKHTVVPFGWNKIIYTGTPDLYNINKLFWDWAVSYWLSGHQLTSKLVILIAIYYIGPYVHL